MDIRILQLVEGARDARGLTVIIDVFRAFSLECYAFDRGAEKIIPVGDIETAYRLKASDPSMILIGERNERKMPGFDFGNSPSQIVNEDFRGKTLIHTTSAGTQGLVNASGADELLTASFVNAGAVAVYIKKRNPEYVSLVCMGYSAKYPVEEDTYCAEFIRNELLGIPSDFEEMKRIIRQTSGKRFFEIDKQEFAPSSDFELCLDLNRFSFIIKAENTGYGITLKKINS
jgi:2-phosphosulfolactate phosphatase